jgi:hypothetical protein
MEFALTGTKLLYDNLNDMTVAIRDKLLKRAMGRATRAIEKAAKDACPADTGTLKDSIATKTTSRGGRGHYIKAFIGPKRNVKVPVDYHKGGLGLPPFVSIPTRYAHLVEFGHNIVNRKGEVVGHVGPRSFMRKAWDEAGGEKAVDTFEAVLGAGIAQEVLRSAISSTKTP